MASVENGGVVAAAASKIRLVRCPRCRQVLPELPNVPVYKCGGCGIHLQDWNPAAAVPFINQLFKFHLLALSLG
ncbi:Protein ENHANCED DISEASE RESISTANCE 4 [Linum perenne]